jgi:predicted RNase H-like HicB family nuclease
MGYVIVIEKGQSNYGAYLPDLPGCFAVGESLEEIKDLIAEAIVFHLEDLREEGMTIPKSVSLCEYVDVA